MPIYEYACQKCGHQLDALQKISDPPLRKCPACGALRLKRLVSAPQFRLKGTGWYETDFKGDGEKRKWLVDGGAATAGADAAAAADAGEAGAAKPAKAETPAADKPAKPGKPAKTTKPAGSARAGKRGAAGDAAGSQAG